MVGLTTSQSRGLDAQFKQLYRVNSNRTPTIHRKYLESLHGVKYYRKDNNRGDIRYIPKNLKNTLK